VKAVVIPSPARREIPELSNAWVMKEVPTRQTGANTYSSSNPENDSAISEEK